MSTAPRSCASKQDLLDLSNSLLDPAERPAVLALLERVQGPLLELNDLWWLMDEVWDTMALDNQRPDWNRIGEYYAHPVWLLNGIFAEADPVSRHHRESWRNWMKNDVSDDHARTRVVDFGGGFGVLAALLAEDPATEVEIVEPHPPPTAHKRFAHRDNVHFVSALGNGYDYAFCSDVLEHVADPVGSLIQLSRATKPRGKLMIANNFFPVIKCHLPATFHLRHSFSVIARLTGLRSQGLLPCGHGEVFEKVSSSPAGTAPARLMEFLSQQMFRTRNRLSRWRRLGQRTTPG